MLESRLMPTIRRCLLALFATGAILAWGSGNAAAQVLQADLNADGIRDTIAYSSAGTDLIVRTSVRPRPQHLHAHDRIVRVVLSDLNHDGRLDIVAITRRAGILVWLNSGSGRFKWARPQPARAPDWRQRHAGGAPSSVANDDGSDGSAMLVTTRPLPPLEGTFCPFLQIQSFLPTRHAPPRVPRGPPPALALV